MAAEGTATRAIGRALGCTTGTASKWRVRYAKARLAGFSEVGARGTEPKYDGETDRRILALLDTPPPKGYANWSGPLIAKALGDVKCNMSGDFYARKRSILPAANPDASATIRSLPPRPPRSLGSTWRRPRMLSCSPSTKSRRFRRSNARRAYLKLPNGRAITGQSHDYKRNGTTTLFAALDLKSGKVVGRHYKRRRRVEFLDFMNKVVADHPDREIHVVLDNLSTHKPKHDM